MMSDKKYCCGVNGEWFCEDATEDHMVDIKLFRRHRGQRDGLQGQCINCRRVYDLGQGWRNPKKNAVSSMVYKAVGGARKFYELPKSERWELRRVAALEYHNVVNLDMKPKVISKIPKFHYPPEHEKRLRRDGMSVETAIKARRAGRTDGFVYNLWHPRDPDMYKVGYAYDPRSRLSTYNVGCPNALYEMHYISPYFEDARLAEGIIQGMLIDYHHRAEWYRVDLDTAIEAIKNYVESIERTRREVGKGQTIPLC